ncbi:hypothetical protein [Sphingomonas sp.]|jgi:hypothetical protein|uniref:hypothetical protein n=1 Tax=Sphingomonas sp. TaxID=28214 RepID=UPI0035686B64
MPRNPKAEPFVLPEADMPAWLPKDSWRDFESARNTSAYPLTVTSTRAALRRLDKMRATGVDIADVLDQATASGWRGLFADARQTVATARDAAAESWQQFRESIRCDRMPEDGRLQRIIRKFGGLSNLGMRTSRDLDMLKPDFVKLLSGEMH